jgi:hypothetical protein
LWVKGKVVPVHPICASENIHPFILNPGIIWGWVVSFMPWPLHSRWKSSPRTHLRLFHISSHSIWTAFLYQWILHQLTLIYERKIICWVLRKVVVIYILLTNTRNLLNQTKYATCFGQPWHPQAPCKVAVIYIMPLNTPNLLNVTLYATCFGRSQPYSGTEVHNLQNSSGHAVLCNLWNLRNFTSVIVMEYYGLFIPYESFVLLLKPCHSISINIQDFKQFFSNTVVLRNGNDKWATKNQQILQNYFKPKLLPA